MKLVKIETFDAERLETALAGFTQMPGAAVWYPASVRPRQAAFRGDPHARSVAAQGRERSSDQTLVVSALGLIPAVGVGSVEKPDARIERRMNDRRRPRVVAIRLGGEPHAAETQGMHGNDPNGSRRFVTYCRRAASQFITMVIGAEFSSSALRLIRKRWPSPVTTY